MTLCPRAGLHAYLHSRCGHVVLSNIHPNTSQYIVRIVPNTGHATKYCTLPSLPGPFSWLFLSFSWLSFFLSAALSLFALLCSGDEEWADPTPRAPGGESLSLSLSFFRQGCGQGKFPYPRALRRPRLLRRRRVKLSLSLSLSSRGSWASASLSVFRASHVMGYIHPSLPKAACISPLQGLQGKHPSHEMRAGDLGF